MRSICEYIEYNRLIGDDTLTHMGIIRRYKNGYRFYPKVGLCLCVITEYAGDTEQGKSYILMDDKNIVYLKLVNNNLYIVEKIKMLQ